MDERFVKLRSRAKRYPGHYASAQGLGQRLNKQKEHPNRLAARVFSCLWVHMPCLLVLFPEKIQDSGYSDSGFISSFKTVYWPMISFASAAVISRSG